MRFGRRRRKRARLDLEQKAHPDGGISLTELNHPDIVQYSPLLNLPGEIRIEILRQLLSDHIIHIEIKRYDEGAQFGWPQGRVKPVKPWITAYWCERDCTYKFNDTQTPGSWRHRFSLQGSWALNVILVCRQLHQEALAVIYSTNLFDFTDLIVFGDFATQFPKPLRKIRHLQARHKVPTLGPYSRVDPSVGLRAAVKLSWDGPAMFFHYVTTALPQLKNMKLLFERTWMTSEYEARYSKRHEEWIRYILQLAAEVGQPNYVSALRMPWHERLAEDDG